jgi:hypothetical protein
MIALQGWRHLHTAMAGDAVEMVLVALVAAAQRAIEPKARLHCGVIYQMIPLLG